MIGACLIMLICVLVNHLGLIEAIEGVIHKRLLIINCCKCSTFWFSGTYLIISTKSLLLPLACALLLAYVAIWLELALGAIDKYYDKIYYKIYGNGYTEASATSSDKDNTKGPLPEMQ